MKDIGSKLYPAIIAVLSLALIASLWNRFEISVEAEPAADPIAAPISPAPIVPSIKPTPTPKQSLRPPPPASSPSIAPPAIAPTRRQGSLRISNQSNHPVRVALLPQPEGDVASFAEPIHWDFAPEEGSLKGLRLSLPNGDLKIQEGDVVVAFAQDGSRQYWGPFVVGKTALPAWQAATAEWQLVLQP